MKIGFIGLGLMGEPIAQNLLLKSNEELIVYDVKLEMSTNLKNKGALVATSISEVVRTADLIFSMVPRDEHVLTIFDEVLNNKIDGKVFIEMSTISPTISIEIADKVKQKGAFMLDCPVVKSRPAAINGTLGIYVGGDQEVYNNIKYIFDFIGENNIYLGSNGNGLIMKLCHNTLVAQIQNGVNEMLSLAKVGANIDIGTFAQAVSYGGAQNFYLDSKKETLIKRDYSTMFSVENMDKDVKLTKAFAEAKGIKLAGLENVTNVYTAALNNDLGHSDFSATIKLFEEKNE